MSTVVPTTKSDLFDCCCCWALFICCWCSCICAGVIRPVATEDVTVDVANVVDGITDGTAGMLGAGLTATGCDRGSIACNCRTAAGLNVALVLSIEAVTGREVFVIAPVDGLTLLPVDVRFLRLRTASYPLYATRALRLRLYVLQQKAHSVESWVHKP